ncbi:MAG: VTT domain-containing protein [Dehalococcoidia bacterium]|nr:VTT domain-containing protein [Dehalococcoidia bacterium]
MKNDDERVKAELEQAEEKEEIRPGFWTKERVMQLVTLILVIALFFLILWQRENILEFSQSLRQYGALKYIGIFIISAAASATIVIPIPGLAMTSAFGAFSADPWETLWYGVASGLGATLGEFTGYMLGYSGRMAIPDNKTYEQIVGWMRKWGSWTIFVLALIPNPLFDIAGLAAGILKYPAWKFLLVGAAGRLPKHIFFSYFGYWGINLFTR